MHCHTSPLDSHNGLGTNQGWTSCPISQGGELRPGKERARKWRNCDMSQPLAKSCGAHLRVLNTELPVRADRRAYRPQIARASILLHINTIPKKSSSVIYSYCSHPSPTAPSAPKSTPPTPPHAHSVNKAEQRKGQELQGKEQEGRNNIKTMPSLKERKKGRGRTTGKENKTTDTFQTIRGKLSQPKSARKRVQESAKFCGRAHTHGS